MDGQTIFAILAGSALACFSLVMVGYSFFRGNGPAETSAIPARAADDDRVALEDLLDSIDTLELEYQLGNVPQEQYQDQLGSYRLQVAAAIKEQLERDEAPPELALEREVLHARSTADGNWRRCPQCDAPLPAPVDGDTRAASCPHCNAMLATNGASIPPIETGEESPARANSH